MFIQVELKNPKKRKCKLINEWSFLNGMDKNEYDMAEKYFNK